MLNLSTTININNYMKKDVKNNIIEKLTKKQLFVLILLGMINFTLIVLIICLLAPEMLPSLFENIF